MFLVNLLLATLACFSQSEYPSLFDLTLLPCVSFVISPFLTLFSVRSACSMFVSAVYHLLLFLLCLSFSLSLSVPLFPSVCLFVCHAHLFAEAIKRLETFVQKYKRAFVAVGMEESETFGESIVKAKKKLEVLKALCTEGLLWHAFTHDKKAITDAIIDSVVEELAADEVNASMIHEALIAEAKARRG